MITITAKVVIKRFIVVSFLRVLCLIDSAKENIFCDTAKGIAENVRRKSLKTIGIQRAPVHGAYNDYIIMYVRGRK